MRISITYSMVLTALALLSTTLAAPSTPNPDEHAVSPVNAPDLNSVVGSTPVLGPMLAPITSLLGSIGITDPTKLTQQQQDIISKLTSAISGATDKVKATLPVIPALPVSLPIILPVRSEEEREYVSSYFASSDFEDHAESSSAAQKREFGVIGPVGEFGALLDEESGSLEANPYWGDHLQRQVDGIHSPEDSEKIDDEAPPLPGGDWRQVIAPSVPLPVAAAAPNGVIPSVAPPLFAPVPNVVKGLVSSVVQAKPTGLPSTPLGL